MKNSEEHEDLLAAILAGDRSRAKDAIRDHLTNTSLMTIEILKGSATG